MSRHEIEADSVAIVTDDGTEVELQYRKSDGQISLSINGRMVIMPYATNVVRIKRDGN
jgi:hypothetical protein